MSSGDAEQVVGEDDLYWEAFMSRLRQLPATANDAAARDALFETTYGVQGGLAIGDPIQAAGRAYRFRYELSVPPDVMVEVRRELMREGTALLAKGAHL